MVFTSNAPRVLLTERSNGPNLKSPAAFNGVVVLGTAPIGGNEPTFVNSVDDFTNVFGASPSTAVVTSYFRQQPGAGLTFCNVPARATRPVTITLGSVGAVYSLTVDGFTISYTGVTGDTLSTVTAALAARVNNAVPQTVRMDTVTGGLRFVPTAVITGNAAVVPGSVVAAPATPVPADVSDYLASRRLTSDMPLSFLVAPEFYSTYTSASDRTLLASTIEAFVSRTDLNWIHFVDPGLSAGTSVSGGTALNLAIAERQALSSPRGNSAYFWPWLTDGVTPIAPSLVVAGIAQRLYRETGTQVAAFAGESATVAGYSPVFLASEEHQSVLNPLNINVIRRITNLGTVLWGARTLANLTVFQYINQRVNLSSLGRALLVALRPYLFDNLDALGPLRASLRATASGACDSLYRAGGLYGETADQAYRVVCDASNNSTTDIANGIVRLTVLAKLSPVAEFIVLDLANTALTTNLTESTAYGV